MLVLALLELVFDDMDDSLEHLTRLEVTRRLRLSEILVDVREISLDMLGAVWILDRAIGTRVQAIGVGLFRSISHWVNSPRKHFKLREELTVYAVSSMQAHVSGNGAP